MQNAINKISGFLKDKKKEKESIEKNWLIFWLSVGFSWYSMSLFITIQKEYFK